MNVTLPELRDRLFQLTGATMVTMVARTKPDMVGGKKCPLAGLEKVSRVNGVINWHYGNAVNRQRIRENQPTDENGNVEQFVPQARSWGVRLFEEMQRADRYQRLLPLVAKKWEGRIITLAELQSLPVDELYLEYKPEQTLEYHYYLGDREIPHDEAHQHIRQSKQPATQQTDKEIRLRDYKLTSIEQITLQGEHFVVVK
jgi:hypothetical protein